MATIHPTAIIDKGATLAHNVEVGPYCVIGPEVVLEEGVKLLSHVCLSGVTRIGKGTRIFPFASIGHAPQDLKYKGEKTELIIGENNTIREHVTMNPGTAGGGGVTRVGDHGLFMMSAHVAHDCQIGNHVIMANNATLGGHVVVEDYAVIGGLAAIHQFVRVGKHAIIGGMSGVANDVIPYGSVVSERASLAGLNLVGLKRRGFERDVIHALRNAYKMLFESDSGTLYERVSAVQEQFTDCAPVNDIIEFIENKGSRSLCVPKQKQPLPEFADS